MMGPRDALVVTLKPRPRILRPVLDYAKTTRVNIIMVTDQMSMLWAQKYGSVTLPCHVASQGLGPSIQRWRAPCAFSPSLTRSARAERAAERLDLIAEIHEELGDTSEPAASD